MKTEYEEYKAKTKETDRLFSPSFCLAKWYHSNIYFQTGETHSCYHPAPHKINREDLSDNPSALHNTATKLNERRQMLAGERPIGCQYCWNIEDLGEDLISDRHIRTGSLFKQERLEEIRVNGEGPNTTPDYIEISFSNKCNFMCGYCHPRASSRYLQEIESFGPYPSKNHRCDIDWFTIYEEEDNPFIAAWWKWWPDLSQKLKILRLTGGEPLLQKSTYRLIDFLRDSPKPNLELNINTNMGAPRPVVNTFIEKINLLVQQKNIGAFKLFSSIDTWGPQAEYIRTGLKLDLFEENIRRYLEETRLPLTLMVTFNIFSIPSFETLLKKILQWRSEFHQDASSASDFHRIRFDTPYLKEPLQYDINILPKEEFMPRMTSILNFMEANTDDGAKDKFSYMEYQRFLRIYEYMKNTTYSDEKIAEGRSDFYTFFTEYDKRRKTNLLETFPELEPFWRLCAESAT